MKSLMAPKAPAQHTSSRLHESIDLVSSIHGAEVKKLDNRTRLLQLGGIVGRRRKLLEDLPPHTSCRLLLLYYRAVAEVALNKQLHFLVPDENIAYTNVIKPPLHQRLDPGLILLSPRASRSQRWRDSRNDCLGICRDQVLCKFDKFGMETSNIAILRGSISGQACL